MSKGLLHQDERKNLEKSFRNVFLEGGDVSRELVQGGGEGGTEPDAEHGLQHGHHVVFDRVLDGSRQHADASKDGWIQGRCPPLVGVFFRRQGLLDAGQHVLEVGLHRDARGHGKQSDGQVGVVPVILALQELVGVGHSLEEMSGVIFYIMKHNSKLKAY